MWRIVVTIILVLLLDCVLFYIAIVGTLDVNMVQISRALGAQMDNPSPEDQRALDAAKREAALIQFKIRLGFGVAIVVLTAGGFFVVGRQFERRRQLRAGFQAS